MPTDVLVVGAGPGGCAAALALARRGRQVMLMGVREVPDRRLAGEWLQPAGVTALRELGIGLCGDDVIENHGFVLHLADGRAPVALPYPHGVAVTMRHHALVDRLRQTVSEQPGVTLLLGDRVTQVTEDGWATTSAGTIQAKLIVGADGRASIVRRALRPQDPPAASLSTTAGFELTGAGLPEEGYGHVFLGGPAPILAYRISQDTVRLSIDVPRRQSPPTEMLGYLQRAYAPALPENLRAAFLRTTTHQLSIRWAANRVRMRRFYGNDRCALIGDAVGFGHPLSALGMTAALLDAECLARHGHTTNYARERRTRSWAPERVGLALHRALTGTDTASLLLRESLLHLWRVNKSERDRMMRLLAIQEHSRTQFGLAVAHIITTALPHTKDTGLELPRGRALTRQAHTTLNLAAWLYWLCGPTTGIPPTKT
jgi:squalene monooxygenase